MCIAPTTLLVDAITAGSLTAMHCVLRREFIQVIAKSSMSLQLSC